MLSEFIRVHDMYDFVCTQYIASLVIAQINVGPYFPKEKDLISFWKTNSLWLPVKAYPTFTGMLKVG